MESTTRHHNNGADLYSHVMRSLSPRVMQYPIPFPTFTSFLDVHEAELLQLRLDLVHKNAEIFSAAQQVTDALVGMSEYIINYDGTEANKYATENKSLYGKIGSFWSYIMQKMKTDEKMKTDPFHDYRLLHRALIIGIGHAEYDTSKIDGGISDELIMIGHYHHKSNYIDMSAYYERGNIYYSKLPFETQLLLEVLQLNEGFIEDSTCMAGILNPETTLETDAMVAMRLRSVLSPHCVFDRLQGRWTQRPLHPNLSDEAAVSMAHITELRNPKAHCALIQTKLDLIGKICDYVCEYVCDINDLGKSIISATTRHVQTDVPSLVSVGTQTDVLSVESTDVFGGKFGANHKDTVFPGGAFEPVSTTPATKKPAHDASPTDVVDFHDDPSPPRADSPQTNPWMFDAHVYLSNADPDAAAPAPSASAVFPSTTSTTGDDGNGGPEVDVPVVTKTDDSPDVRASSDVQGAPVYAWPSASYDFGLGPCDHPALSGGNGGYDEYHVLPDGGVERHGYHFHGDSHGDSDSHPPGVDDDVGTYDGFDGHGGDPEPLYGDADNDNYSEPASSDGNGDDGDT